uniref:Prenylcysteine oxidase 1 n=1 Tax=Malurus cyaneus samueli TaxID=2593467 RepID=A0A8C5TNL9_9PASS
VFIIIFLKLLWHYGSQPLGRMSMWGVRTFWTSSWRILSRRDTGMMHDYAFSSNERLLHALGARLHKAGFSQKFINEVVCPPMRINYGQGVTVNGFVGALSLAWVQSGLWSVKGGNKLVCSGPHLLLQGFEVIPATVVSIVAKTRPSCTGHLQHILGLTGRTLRLVLIAAPLPQDGQHQLPELRPPIPEFPTLPPGRHYPGARASLDVVSPVEDSSTGGKLPLQFAVWRVFSNKVLTKEQLNLLFSSYDSVKVKPWLAYPEYSAPEKFPPIVLHEHLYYLNGLERAASAMEMSAIAARNAALLAFHRWHGHSASVDQEDLHEKLKTEL